MARATVKGVDSSLDLLSSQVKSAPNLRQLLCRLVCLFKPMVAVLETRLKVHTWLICLRGRCC